MTRDELMKIIGDGKIFSATFTKADGTERRVVARLGVTKHLKGTGKKFDDAEKNIVTCWDFTCSGYRSFRVDRLHSVRAHGDEMGGGAKAEGS